MRYDGLHDTRTCRCASCRARRIRKVGRNEGFVGHELFLGDAEDLFVARNSWGGALGDDSGSQNTFSNIASAQPTAEEIIDRIKEITASLPNLPRQPEQFVIPPYIYKELFPDDRGGTVKVASNPSGIGFDWASLRKVKL